MTGNSQRNQPAGSGLRPPGEHFPEFSEWQAAHTEAETDTGTEPAVHGDKFQESADHSGGASAEMRVFASTLPYGLFLVVSAFIAAHMNADETDPTLQLIGLGLIIYSTSIGCELTSSYAMGDAYPAWGMWGWLNHPRIGRIFGKAHRAIGRGMDNGCLLTAIAALALPAIFAGLWVFSAAAALARELWITSVLVATVAHIGLTATRCYSVWRGTP